MTRSGRVALRLACLVVLIVRSPLDVRSQTAETGTGSVARGALQGSDTAGDFHRLGERSGTKSVVLAFLATECPISNAALPALNHIATERRRAGVEVYGVVSAPGTSRAAADAHREAYRLKFPVLFDASGELRRKLGATHTPHAFLLTCDGRVLYQGAIDDRYAAVGRKKTQATATPLADALEAALSGRPVAVASTPPVGCLLEDAPDPLRAGTVTFNRDIAPILFARCARCHRPGESAPFSLLTYEDACRHARQIAAVTTSRQMPPWKAVAGYGEFKDERRLTEREIALVAAWSAGGKPAGDAADLPPAPRFPAGWQLGKPDLVLSMPKEFELPASGEDRHQHFVLSTGISETRLISAIEFRPGNPRVVHHACFYLDNTGAARKLDAADNGPGYGGGGGAGFVPYGALRSWLPGLTPRRLPQGSGRAILKGTDLVLELHYQCSGRPESDRSSIGIYFAPPKARQLVDEIQILNYRLDIPAGEKWHRHSASYTLPNDAILLDTAPHMHLLGKEMKATATTPDGRAVPLVWVKDWNYLWQEQYEYREPVRLPAGTRIDVDAWFDNSAENPLNPHSPPQRVTWGEQTKEEMAVCHFQFTCDRMQDYVALNQSYARHRMGMAEEIRAAQAAAAEKLDALLRVAP